MLPLVQRMNDIRRGGTLIGHESYPLAVSKGSVV